MESKMQHVFLVMVNCGGLIVAG